MNSQPGIRAVVCAAIVALCITGVGWFSFRPVAGQEAKEQTLRGAAALDRLKRDGQYESLQAAMNQARFGVSRAEATPLGRAAWRAPNAAAGYDAYVTEEGVSIALNDETYVSLNLRGIGYGEALQAVGWGEISGDRQTINLIRHGGLREWYVNGPGGLEHGFTLSEPPGARQKGAPLRLALQVGEGWQAAASEDGQFVNLRGANAVIEYGKLVARDGLGRNIPSRLGVAGEQVVIEVEDYDAAYPLTIDPLFTLQQKLAAADGAAEDNFGQAVALSGNTAVVGAPYDDVTHADQGSAYVFVRNGATWTQQARLTALDGAAKDGFGYAVALSGDTLVAGAPYDDIGENQNQGSVHVFTRSGAVWTQQQKLTAGDGGGGDEFGFSVALDGDTLVVGARLDDVGANTDQGSAYVFTRSAAAWTQQQKITSNDGAREDSFGVAVALDSDTLVVGALFADLPDIGANKNQGSAYVFTRSGALWTQQQKITASDGAGEDYFGSAVALSGATLVVGASFNDIGANQDQGSVYVFTRSGVVWTQQKQLTPNDGAAYDHFGFSVALSGDTLVVGAPRDDIGANQDQGSAYVFMRSGVTWSQQRKMFSADGQRGDDFGCAVALNQDTALVGAFYGSASAADQGTADVFVVRDNRHIEQQRLSANDGAAFDYFGNAIALSDDTLVVGLHQSQGAAYVFKRSGATWTLQQKLTADDGAANDLFGSAVAISGDTLVVGAKGDTIGANRNQGSAYIFTRSGAVWTPQQKITAGDGARDDFFGWSVAISGDTVAVGAWLDDIGANLDQGSAYVFTRSGAVWTLQQKITSVDGAGSDEFGFSVALSGDTLVVGARFHNIGANGDQGSAYVFTRSGAAWTQQQKIMASDGAAYDHFGSAVAISGDTVVVGAPDAYIGGNQNQGSTYVFARSGAAWTQQQKITASDGATTDNFGGAVAISGDTLVVGAEGDTIGASRYQGSAYAFTRGGAVWTQQQKITASDGAAEDHFGHAVALSGDTLMASVLYDAINGNSNQGSVYVFVSPPCPAVTIEPASLPDGAVGASYQQAVIVSGGAGTYQFALAGGALPPGLTLARDGLLSGTPMTAGAYQFRLSATNLSSLCSGSRDYAVTITPPCPTLTLNPASLPSARQGATYNQTLTATGGATPYAFAVAGGALPPGLSLSAGGSLSGTPTQPGSYSFTARGADANGCVAKRDYTLVVSASAAHVSSASYKGDKLAPDSIVAAFGANLATETRAAQSLPLPTELAGATVTIRDSQGKLSPAPLFFVSPNQINYLMPSGLANGVATVTITNGQGVELESQIQISAVAPGLFTANASGGGPASALALRVRANGQQVYELVTRYDAQTQTFVLEPIDLSDAAEQVYLILFGTGIRHRASLEDMTVETGGTRLPVAYAGAAPEFVGVDQINAQLPRSLAGRGEVDVSLFVGGKAANTVRVNIR